MGCIYFETLYDKISKFIVHGSVEIMKESLIHAGYILMNCFDVTHTNVWILISKELDNVLV